MRPITLLILGGLTLGACRSDELDLARQVVLAEQHEEAARRELLRLERELATDGASPELDKKLAAQRQIVRAAEIEARKLRIQSKQ